MSQPDMMPSFMVIIEQQFTPALEMIAAVIDVCPDDLWVAHHVGPPIWKRLLHTLESLDFFFNDFGPYFFKDSGILVSAEFDGYDNGHLSKPEMRNYLDAMKVKCKTAFSMLTDGQLYEYSTCIKKYTYLDIFLVQLRHCALNTGRCHETLSIHGVTAPAWIGFGE